MGPIRSPSGESARHEDAQKRLISATAAAQKRRVGGLAYESPAALRGWRSGEQAGTCSAVLGAAGESRERGRGWPPRAAKAKYRTIFSTGEATRRSNGPGQPREAAPRKSRKPRNVKGIASTDATPPFGCYPPMLLGVYERGHGRLAAGARLAATCYLEPPPPYARVRSS